MSRLLIGVYKPFVYVALRRPISTVAIGLLAVVSAVSLSRKLGHEFMPPLNQKPEATPRPWFLPSRARMCGCFFTASSVGTIPIGVLGNIIFSLLVTDRDLLASLHEFPRGYLVLAIALGLLPWLTNTLRLYIWARFLGHDLRLRDCFQMTLAVDLGSAISPTAVGGGFFKWGMLVQRGVTPGTAASLTTFPIIEDALSRYSRQRRRGFR